MKKDISFKIWLIIISVIFFLPFVGVFINEITSAYFCNLYTLGLDRKDFFTVWIALFGAIGIAFNIHQNHLRTTNQDKQLVNQNIQLEKQAEQIQLQGIQIELQSKSQRDSRFYKGVELLGNANESTRTGATYSLFFLAKDYPEEFAKPVFEIFCSHIRNITTTEEYKKNNNKRPSNEIQSILNLLFKNQSLDLDGSFWSEEREQEEDEEYIRDTIFKDFSPNLSHSYLKYADLIEANLYGAQFSNSNLEGAFLAGSCLQESVFEKTILIKANICGANLCGSFFLSGTKLNNADLEGATLDSLTLDDVILDYAKISKDDFSMVFSANKTNLEKVDWQYNV